jgi:hypothetical protein
MITRKSTVDAIIGNYKVRMETNELVLTHSTGNSFLLTREEVVGLFNFIKVYQETLMLELADTEPRIEIISLKKAHHLSEPSDLPHIEGLKKGGGA